MMADDIKNNNEQLERLESLEGLVNRYAQSRTLGLWIPLLLIVINMILLVGSIELALRYGYKIGIFWTLMIMGLVVLWVLF